MKGSVDRDTSINGINFLEFRSTYEHSEEGSSLPPSVEKRREFYGGIPGEPLAGTVDANDNDRAVEEPSSKSKCCLSCIELMAHLRTRGSGRQRTVYTATPVCDGQPLG